ncbi:hypothetical protein M1E08_09590 [Erwinia sp. PK3-005]
MLGLKLKNETLNWWCGTVIVGALPIIIRLIISILSKKNIELINATELICFGFSIQISSIYFSVGQLDDALKNNVMINATLSIVFIVILSVLYSVTMIFPESFDLLKVKILLVLVCAISLYTGQNSVNCAIIANKMA